MKTLPLLALLLTLPACSALPVEDPLTGKHGGSDPDAQMEFWHELYDRKLTSNDEALHGLILFLDGKDDSADYPARIATLKQRGLLAGNFDAPGNVAAKRGDLAVIIMHALKIKGGLATSIAPYSPRYAMRELQYVGIYPPGSPWQPFTGGQFVSIIGRLEDYTRANPTDLPAKQLPDGETPAAPAKPDGENKPAPVKPEGDAKPA